MKKIALIAGLLASFISTASAQTPAPAPTASPVAPAVATDSAAPVDPVKDAEIRKLLMLTGTVKIAHQVMDRMIASFRMQNSSVPDEFWTRFEKEMNPDELIDKMVPVYAKYYSLEDLQAVNAFYQTPVGKKVLSTTPQIMQESMQIGQDWGRSVAQRLADEMKAEKSQAAPAPAPAPSAH